MATHRRYFAPEIETMPRAELDALQEEKLFGDPQWVMSARPPSAVNTTAVTSGRTLEKAAGLLGARYSSANATAMDAPRTEYLVNQLRPRAVVGVKRAGGRRTAGARSRAWRRVRRGSFRGHGRRCRVAHAGRCRARAPPVGQGRPDRALECAQRSGLHIDGERWNVDVKGDEVVISNRAARLTPSTRLPTGFAGLIAPDPCPCGRPGPRLVPAAPGPRQWVV